jgi:DNA (cytosine-5)-methyltransferase 1
MTKSKTLLRDLDAINCSVAAPLTFGSLFAGVGGIDLGLERAGMQCKWQVEINPFARAVLAKHWPEVPKHDDIRTFQPNSVDVVAGGFPCQDISSVGHRAGIDGARSGLWSEYLRVIRTIRPRFVIVENVAALLVRGMDRVCGDLASSGYDAEWDCFPAGAFGAPHQRDRVFICAYPTGSGLQGCLQAVSFNRKAGEGWNGEPTRILSRDWYYGSNVHRHTGMDDGIPDRVERIRGYGNAVVPQVAEYIGRCIVAASGNVA